MKPRFRTLVIGWACGASRTIDATDRLHVDRGEVVSVRGVPIPAGGWVVGGVWFDGTERAPRRRQLQVPEHRIYPAKQRAPRRADLLETLPEAEVKAVVQDVLRIGYEAAGRIHGISKSSVQKLMRREGIRKRSA